MKTLLKKMLSKKKDYNLIYPDDTFIVSYPKSGNTWMRFLLANYMKTDNKTIDFINVINYIPEYAKHKEALVNVPRPRYIKSHNTFTTKFPKVLYIIRDPKDAYVSYYHYLLKRLPAGTTFKNFLRIENYRPSNWYQHVTDWEKHPNILIVKYEDLKSDTFAEMSKILNFLNFKVDDSKLQKAINEASFENMKVIEKEKGRPYVNEEEKKKSTDFMRKGTIGDWKNYFDDDDLNYIQNECGYLIEKYAYNN